MLTKQQIPPSIHRVLGTGREKPAELRAILADTTTYTPTLPHTVTPAPDSLLPLIAACRREDRAAQRRLYDTYSSLVWGIVRRYTEAADKAEDIHSEAFCRIFSRLSQYRFEGAFEGWIRRITVHAVADYFRKHRPAVALSEHVEDRMVCHSASALSGLSYKELLDLIQSLPATQRAVFNLAVFEQYSHREIGAMLGITENNSRWHLNDARRRLKEKLIAPNR